MTILIKGAHVTVTSSIFLHLISDCIYIYILSTYNHTFIPDDGNKVYDTDFCLIAFIKKKNLTKNCLSSK